MVQNAILEEPGRQADGLSASTHGGRIVLVMAAAIVVLVWGLRHTEASFADGLRYIRQAETIDRGSWRDGLIGAIDHPLHPLGIVAAHAIVGGDGPVSWQRAASALAFGCIVLMVIPLYLLAKDVFGEESAWLGSLLVVANPLLGSIAANVLSESSFLLFWTWGLWSAVRFLRAGRFVWLPLTIGFGVLAYLSRPEGLLLPLAMVLVLAVLPLHGATRINWPRWSAAVVFLVLGSLVLAGPYMALKGSVGTKPAVARVLGLADSSHPQGLERERPLPPDQTALETYRLATLRMVRVVRTAATTPLVLLGIAGFLVMPSGPARPRTWLFLGIVMAASAIGLVRLHATGGYCTARHALVPGILLMLAGAHGLTWLIGRIAIPVAWSGQTREQLRPGPAVWAVVAGLLIVAPRLGQQPDAIPGPFSVYRDTGDWLAENAGPNGRILDLTDWSLYFSRRPGYRFAQIYEAPADSELRWVVIRQPHLDGHWAYASVVRNLVQGRDPVAVVPVNPGPGQLQVRIYDRRSTGSLLTAAKPAASPDSTRK